MNDKPLIDLSPETIEQRKVAREKLYKFAEQMWDDLGQEGGEIEKKYWIHGFVSGYKLGEI